MRARALNPKPWNRELLEAEVRVNGEGQLVIRNLICLPPFWHKTLADQAKATEGGARYAVKGTLGHVHRYDLKVLSCSSGVNTREHHGVLAHQLT